MSLYMCIAVCSHEFIKKNEMSLYFIKLWMKELKDNNLYFYILYQYLILAASGEFCHLLTIFANSLDPDQARQNVGPDLDPNCLTL